MKPFVKLLIPLFIIVLILIIPVSLLLDTASFIYTDSYLSLVVNTVELYHILAVVAVFGAILAYALARGFMGTHRALYSGYGIALVAITYFISNPLSLLLSQIAAIVAVVLLNVAYFNLVKNIWVRASYAAMAAPVVYLLLYYPFSYLAFIGFAVFVLSFAVGRSTITDSIALVNVRPSFRSRVKASVKPPKPAKQPKAPRRKGTVAAAAQPASGVMQAPAPKPSGARPSSPPPAPVSSPRAPPSAVAASANVPWPGQSEYARAMQNIEFCISTSYPEMRICQVVPNPYVQLAGNIVYSSGNYGTIFKLENSGSAHALKCFTRSKQDINERYAAISKALKSFSGKGNAFVDFRYLPKAIRTFKEPNTYFPVLLMDWVEGRNLNTFISDNLKNGKELRNLADSFISEMIRIQKAGIAHGDIAGDNIVIDESGEMVLVDYDGMYVPAFAGYRSQELGHDNFQHPQRSATTYSDRLDNFSVLVTYMSLLALAEEPSLWKKYNQGDQDALIFRRSDFTDPEHSPVLKELRKHKGKVGDLARLMDQALAQDPLWEGCDAKRILKT